MVCALLGMYAADLSDVAGLDRESHARARAKSEPLAQSVCDPKGKVVPEICLKQSQLET